MRSKMRPTRRPRRVRRVRRAKRGLGRSVPRRSLQFKPYNYQFKLQPQLLVPSTAALGTYVFNGAQAPFTNLEIFNGSPSSGFSGYQDLGLATSFNLQDINQYQKYTTMYDAYKINKITINVECLSNFASQGILLPTIWMYYDQDDSAVPVLIQTLTGKQGVKKHAFGTKRSVSFSFTPTLQNTAFGNGGSQPVVVASKPQWINCNYPLVPHQALKIWIADTPKSLTADIPTVFAYRINMTYDVSFRSPLAVY